MYDEHLKRTYIDNFLICIKHFPKTFWTFFANAQTLYLPFMVIVIFFLHLLFQMGENKNKRELEKKIDCDSLLERYMEAHHVKVLLRNNKIGAHFCFVVSLSAVCNRPTGLRFEPWFCYFFSLLYWHVGPMLLPLTCHRHTVRCSQDHIRAYPRIWGPQWSISWVWGPLCYRPKSRGTVCVSISK